MAKVLLVEDDNNLREIYQARLAAEGYDIVAAQDGEEALVSAKKEHPDLIISDVMMPRISGFEMLDILRNTDELKNTKVIMLTALGQAEDQSRANSLGADKYLVKSQVTLEDIVKSAQELLSGIDEATAQVVPAPPVAPAEQASASAPAPVAASPAVAEATPVAAQPASEAAAPAPATISIPVMDQPSTAPVSSDPVVSAPSSVPEPVVDVAATPAEPSIPTTPAADAVVTPEPVASEPTTPVTATPDTDTPHTPAPETAVTEEPTQAPDVPAAPVEPTQPSDSAPTPVAAEPVTPEVTAVTDSEPQSLAAEEAAIQKQIQSYEQSVADTATTPASDTSTAASTDDAVIADAVEQLDAGATTATPALAPSEEPANNPAPAEPSIVVPQPPEPEAAPEPTPAPQPISASENVTVAGKKVIQPLSPSEGGGAPSLDELLAKEAAKESTNAEPTPIINGQPASPVDPNAISL